MIINWLATSIRAVIVKFMDFLFSRIRDSCGLRQEKARTILALLNEYGDLAGLYRLQATASVEKVRGEDGAFKKDEQGKFVVEKKLFEVEPRFEEAIKSLKGASVSSAISPKVASIRLAMSNALDIALELDPSGELSKRLRDVDAKTVFFTEFIRDHKDLQDWGTSVANMVAALNEADEARRGARAILSKYLR